MLRITIPSTEFYDEERNLFIKKPAQTLELEHSLVSISTWESKWKKPFLSNNHMTHEESLDYIRCMTLTPNVPEDVYLYLTSENMDQINAYIDDRMSATTVTHRKKKNSLRRRGQIVTSELVYYWMIGLQIPMECQYWHFNRLMMLIDVCNTQQNPEKMSKREILAEQKALNDKRLKELGTTG